MTVVSGTALEWAQDFYATLDNGSQEEAHGRFHPDVRLQFGNAEPLMGLDQMITFGDQWSARFHHLVHRVDRAWRVADTVITELHVSYYGKGGRVITLPAATVTELSPDGLVERYNVYVDANPAMTL